MTDAQAETLKRGDKVQHTDGREGYVQDMTYNGTVASVRWTGNTMSFVPIRLLTRVTK